MRRVPAFVWILAPLAIGLLYAAGHALLAPTPSPANLPPGDAILVHRMRGLDMLDLTSPGPRGSAQRAPRETLGLERNNVGLVGVDHEAWVHLVLMPRTLAQDSTMAIFRLRDKAAFEREFMRTDFLERGLIRHAQHMTIQGDYAAIGPSRDATRRLGTGGITCEDLGEDWSMAADLPRLIDHAVQLAKHYPWRSILRALGIDVDAARMRLDPKENVITAFLPGDERLRRVRESWKTVRLWAWHNDKKLRVDLEPAAGSDVAKALSGLTSVDVRSGPPPPPPSAQAWVRMPSGSQRAALARILLACGVRFVPPSKDETVDPLGGLGANDTGGLLVWAEAGVGTGYAMTVGLAGAAGALPDLRALLPLPASGAQSVALPEGAAPLTVGDTTLERKVPAGTVEFRSATAGNDVLTFGPSATQAAEGMVAFLATDPPTSGVAQGVLGTFFLNQRRAEKVLGRALQPGGFLAMLAGGDIHGTLEFVDGVVRLTASVKR